MPILFEFTHMALEVSRNGDAEEARAMLNAVLMRLMLFAEAGLDVLAGVEEFLFGRSVVAERAQGNLAGLVIGITISAVVAVAVAIPVINDVVASSNATGTTQTVLDLLDLFVALLILVAIASPLMSRTR